MAGRAFDAQVVLSPTDSPRGKLLSQYVCARITRMDDIDIGLFERDWNNTLYYFMMNADEQIYMRYGGRDARSPDSYLNLAAWNWLSPKDSNCTPVPAGGAQENRPSQAAVSPRDSSPGGANDGSRTPASSAI